MDKIYVGDYVRNRLPAFIKDDYTTFSNLITNYFDWLSYNYDNTKFLFSILEDKNIFTITETECDSALQSAGLYEIFSSLSYDRKKTLLFSLNQLYEAKGTRSFIEILFKFFDIDASVFNPRDRLLTLSSSKYYKNLAYVEVDILDVDLLKNGSAVISFSNNQNVHHPMLTIVAISQNRARIIFEKVEDLDFVEPPSVTIYYEDLTTVQSTIRLTKTLNSFSNIIINRYKFSVGDYIYDDSNIIIGYITKLSISKMADLQIVSSGISYKIGDSILMNNKIVGSVTSVLGDGGVVGVALFNQNNEYTTTKPLKIISSTGSGAYILPVWNDGVSPGLPIAAYTAIDMVDKYVGEIFVNDSHDASIVPSSSYVIDLPNLFNLDSVTTSLSDIRSSYITDSNNWQHFSRGISVSLADFAKIPDSLLDHISQVGVNVFIDKPDEETMYLSVDIGYTQYSISDVIDIEKNTMLSTTIGYDTFNGIAVDLILADKAIMTSILSYGEISIEQANLT
jgi:hypothetical protein